MQTSEYSKVDDSMPYAKFLEWNAQCIAELVAEDLSWLTNLTKFIKANKINILDLESCVSFGATMIYFDTKKNLCIVCDR